MKKTKLLSNVRLKIPTILTCVGAIGVVLTSVSASKATLKADKLLKEATNSKKEELTTSEILKIVTPIYVPSILIGASTIACIFGANILNKRAQASLASAYALLDEAFKEYRKKLIELHGEEADIEIRDAIAREHCNYHQIGLDTPDTKMKFYEPISDRFIYAYEKEIMDAEYHLNRNFVLRGYSPLNEFYKFLGLPETEEGDKLGWSCDYGYCWIDFEHRLVENDGDPYYRIVSIFAPDEEYLAQWE